MAEISLPDLATPIVEEETLAFTLVWRRTFQDLWDRISGDKNASLASAINIDTSSSGNVGSGEDDLTTFTLEANILVNDGDFIEITAFGTYAANANNKTVKLHFGSTEIFATAANAANDGAWKFKAIVIRTAAATQKAITDMETDQSTVQGDSSYSCDYTTPSETLSGDVVIKCTGEAVANNDIVQEGLIVKFHAAIA